MVLETPRAVDVRRAAMDLLARREHSFKELVDKLCSRFPQEFVDSEVDKLRQEGLQSDDRYTEGYVRSKQQKGYGPSRIRSELWRKGIASELINDHLFEEDDCWFELARALRVKKFGEETPANIKEKSRQFRFLAQRGFSTSQINQSFKH